MINEHENTPESTGAEEQQPAPEPSYVSPLRENASQRLIEDLSAEVGKVLIGQRDIIDRILICIVANGHVLLEGVPGVAKTLIAKTLARCIKADYSRIQFTPDLMPADILGTSIYNMKTSEFTFKPGPIFSNVVLIDEINRAPAKTQSALFEVMEERQVSFDGETYQMGYPFLVVATQNPVEQEGTYRLPEAQLDRFLMKIIVDYPTQTEEGEILRRYQHRMGGADMDQIEPIIPPERLAELQREAEAVRVEEHMIDYITSIVQETRNNAKIYLGASPRASLAMLHTSKVAARFAGRAFVIPDDVQYVAPDILSHRILLNADAEMAGSTPRSVVDEIIRQIEVPR